jgi:hypothetical protein
LSPLHLFICCYPDSTFTLDYVVALLQDLNQNM